MPSIMPSKPQALLSTAIAACFVLPLLFYAAADASAATYVLEGTTRSIVRITVITTIHVSGIEPGHIANGSKIVFNATYPVPASVGGYSATYSNVDIDVSPAPSRVPVTATDQYGNQYIQYTWDIDDSVSPTFDITATTGFDAEVDGDLSTLYYDDPVGTSAFPEYRSPTGLVQSSDPAIVGKKDELLAGVTSEAEAVDRIMDYVRTSIPDQDPGAPKDALSSMKSHKGNCVNRAHLAMALLRSAGIPVRCVTGVLYADKYIISYPLDGGTASREVAWDSGTHVWLEVYYPGENAWVAYDPWMEKRFVDGRHVRLAVSKDFSMNDTSTRGSAGMLYVTGLSPTVAMSTSVSASDLHDSASLRYKYSGRSPKGALMFGREMLGSSAPTPTITITPAPSPTALPDNATPEPSKPPVSTAGPGPSSLKGDIPRYNLSGTIIDKDKGTPVKGATVMLDSIELSANSTGHFLFLGALSGGTYNLSVSAPGYATDVRAIAPNGGDMDVTVILEAAKSPGPLSLNFLPGPGVLAAMAALAGGALVWRNKRP